MARKLAVTAVLLLAAAFMIPGVLAQPAATMRLDVTSVRPVGGCAEPAPNDPAQLWEVSTHITVHNTSANSITLRDSEFWVRFDDPTGGANQTQMDVSVVDYNGFSQGTQIAADDTRTFDPVLRVWLPCDATKAVMFAGMHIVGSDTQFAANGVFIDNATPVPVESTGAFGIALIIGIAGVLAQRLGRRPKPILDGRQ
jgi:hypothetical protein